MENWLLTSHPDILGEIFENFGGKLRELDSTDDLFSQVISCILSLVQYSDLEYILYKPTCRKILQDLMKLLKNKTNGKEVPLILSKLQSEIHILYGEDPK